MKIAKSLYFQQAFVNPIFQSVTVNVRRSRGKDIDAACGQLAIKRK
ncbi:MAG: hypothetical protein ACLFUB_07320 [Cyclobacteriaceae bacterium]